MARVVLKYLNARKLSCWQRIVLISVGSLISLFPQASEIILQDSFNHIAITQPIATLVEPVETKYTAQQLIKSKQQFSTDLFKQSLKMGRNTYWQKIIIRSNFEQQGSRKVFFVFNNPIIKHLDLFLFDGQALIKTARLGIADRQTASEELKQGMVFEFELQKNQSVSLLIRKQSNGSMILPVDLYSSTGFDNYITKQYFFWGMAIALLAIVALYNAALFLLILSRAYLWYLGLYIVFFIFLGSLDGFGTLIWPDAFQRWLAKHTVELGFFLLWVGLNFSSAFLPIKQAAPWHYKNVKWLQWGALVGCGLAFFIAGYKFFPVFAVYYFIGSIFIITMAVAALKNKFYPARFFLLSYFMVLAGGLISVLTHSGFVSANFFTLHGLFFGVVIELLLLSIALADRLKYSEKKAMAQAYTDPQSRQPNYSFFKNVFLDLLPKIARQQEHLVIILIKGSGFRNMVALLDKDEFELAYQQQLKRLEDLLKESSWSVAFPRSDDNKSYIISLPNDRLLLLASTASTNIENIMESLFQLTKIPISFKKLQTDIYFKIGVAKYDYKTIGAEECYRQAQMALLNCRTQKIKWSVYQAKQKESLINKLGLLSELHNAVNKQQFILYIQPQISCLTNEIIGGEILVRWQNGQKEMVSPKTFIALAEESGLIFSITKIVIDKAFNWFAKTDLEKDNFHLSINLSALDFQQQALIPYIEQKIAQYQLDPKFLVFEITESAVIKNKERFLQVVESLHKIGFRVAIDDFGIEYSSMRYLQQMDADLIKIDIAFVRDIDRLPINQKIVQAIIQMADSTNAITVAEGIETPLELEVLCELGVNSVQGWLTGRPIPITEFKDTYFKRPLLETDDE